MGEILIPPSAVAALCQAAPLVTFAAFLLFRHRQHASACWLAAFCILFSTMQLGWELGSLVLPTRYTPHALRLQFLIGAGVMLPMAMALQQFAYQVVGNPLERESRIVLWVELTLAIAIVGVLVWPSDDALSLFTTTGFPVTALATLGVAISTPIVLMRKSIRYSRQQAGNPKSGWFKQLTNPAGRHARSCTAFAWVGVAWVALILSAVFTWVIPVAPQFFAIASSVIIFLFIYALIVVYATFAEERTTLHVKLVGAVLATLLLFLSIASLALFPNTSIPERHASTTAPHDILFVPDGSGYAATTRKVDSGTDAQLPTADTELRLLRDTTVAVGFPFRFFGATFDSVAIGLNGILTFGGLPASATLDAVQALGLFGDLPSIIPLLSYYEHPVPLGISRTDSSLTIQWNGAVPMRSFEHAGLRFGVTLYRSGVIWMAHRSREDLPQASTVLALGGRGIHGGHPQEGGQGRTATVEFRPGSTVRSSGVQALIEDFALQAYTAVDPYGRTLLWLFVGATGFCLLVIPLVFRLAVLRPVERLLAGVEQVEQGDLSVRVSLPRQDEIGELAEHFNSMTARIEANQIELARHADELEQRVRERTQELRETVTHLRAAQAQLVQQEKLASLGSLTAGIAHEIKNPLNFVNNFAELNTDLVKELLDATANGEPIEELLDDIALNTRQIAAHGKRADGIVRAMMLHASGGSGEPVAVDVNELVEEYIGLAYHGMRAKKPGFNVTLVRNFDEDAGTVTLVPQDIGRVILNILGNAFYAVSSQVEGADSNHAGGADSNHATGADSNHAAGVGGPADESQSERGDRGSGLPTVSVTTGRSAGSVSIAIRDDGPGIPEHVMNRIFEPFFTTKPTGSGTGLGLSLSHEIVTKGHGGSLTVGNADEGGAEFVITLPVQT